MLFIHLGGPPQGNGMGLVGNGMGGNVGGSVPFHAPGSFPDEFDPSTAAPELKKEVSNRAS